MGRIRARTDVFVTISYVAHMDRAANTLALNHVSLYTAPKQGWHMHSGGAGAAGNTTVSAGLGAPEGREASSGALQAALAEAAALAASNGTRK